MNPLLLHHLDTLFSLVCSFEHPADGVLTAYFRKHTTLGSHDRTLVTECLFNGLRHLVALRARITPEQATSRRLALAALSIQPGLNLQALASEDRAYLAQLQQAPLFATEELAAELPSWLLKLLKEAAPEQDRVALGQGFMQSAPLDLRANTLKIKRDTLLKQFQTEGIDCHATPYSPVGIRIIRKRALNQHPLFKNGSFEIQDEGSQILGWILGARRGETVVDFCAGAGGKTLLLGAQMANRGRLYAMDTAENRLANLRSRLKRAGLSCATLQRLTHEHDPRLARLAGKVDRVMVDAPCSGLGTLRRNPDLKFRRNPAQITAFGQQQLSILTAASQLLRPGGRLVYATCSILPQENEHVVQAFLSNHSQFKLKDMDTVLAEYKIPVRTGLYLNLTPHAHQTDGFFAAVLEHIPKVF